MDLLKSIDRIERELKKLKEEIQKGNTNLNLKCLKCGSGFFYYRHKSKERVCRKCGFIFNELKGGLK